MYTAQERSVSETDLKFPPDDKREEDRRPSLSRSSGTKSASKERFGTAHSDSEGSDFSEYGSAMSDQNPYGSQNSSEGELYNLETDCESAPSGYSDMEHLGAICEIASEYDSDSCPSAQSVSDSEAESEDESERVLTLSERLGVIMDNLHSPTSHASRAWPL